MSRNIRFWQKFLLGAGLLLLGSSYFSHDLISGAFALMIVISTIYELLTPTPKQRIDSEIELLQQQGIYPQGQPTDEDVHRVLKAGHKLLAIHLYRELHQVPLKQAVEAIKQIPLI